jgi:hypothetical protein
VPPDPQLIQLPPSMLNGQRMTFEGQPYLLHFTLPDFFFHATTAYLILRYNGIQFGKRDFIGSIPGM